MKSNEWRYSIDNMGDGADENGDSTAPDNDEDPSLDDRSGSSISGQPTGAAQRHSHAGSSHRQQNHERPQDFVMEMPLFPLNTVLFPGMVLPLHIFEPRYREMVNRCVDEGSPFGVVMIEERQEVGPVAKPHRVGTAARISRVDRLEDGRMNIVVVGTQRFRILELLHTNSYLTAKVRHFPVVNGSTRLAGDMVRRVRPKIVEYVDLLAEASQTDLTLDRLPEDATTLAFLVGIALQVNNDEKQKLLELPGVPEMLDRERYLLSWEILLLKHMLATQDDVEQMSGGPTGYIFPN